MPRIFFLAERFIEWLHQKLDKKQFLILSGVLVGLTAGLAAVLLKTLVHYIRLAVTHDYHIKYQYVFYLIFPLIGILLTVLFVQKVLKGKLGRGNANVLQAIAKKGSKLPADQMYSHIVTSALTVGFGGSAGLESPIVTTGSAIGSNYGKTYHLTYKDRTLLLACGAAAGIAAAFSAPIAGVLFALEVLIAEVSISAFIPIMIAAASGALLAEIFSASDITLSFRLQQPFNYRNVLWYAVLGIVAGLISVYYSRVFMSFEGFFKRRKKSPWINACVGGLFIALMIAFFPSLYGEGYESIKALSELKTDDLIANSILPIQGMKPGLILVFISLILLVKPIAAAVTIGSGGNGGNFAPSLFVGAYLGYVFSQGLNLSGITTIPVANFTIVAMAGILSGVFHSPLTAIFLIAEITGGYELIIPLMIVSALSYTVVKYFEPFSMDRKKLAKKGQVHTHDRDRNILTSLRVSRIIENDFQQVSPGMTLGELVNVVANSQRNIFPVTNSEEQLEGIIQLDYIREIMFKSELYDSVIVEDLMRQPPAVVHPDEDMYAVMRKFDETGAWNLPVIDNGKYAGFVSKSSIFTRYRNQLIKHSAE